ncbi:hypothetical protein SAMN05444158_0342 [Bradyrhizobium canariense]|uniref:Uncharacterized protein n=1 Tax=Bradyrhizobium canariense TaxID=255045 RepID=A0A1H1MTA2_9BRAD|nr:hypothetical protein SAMN05444158_0342 [Bradyrhizobium canariense]
MLIGIAVLAFVTIFTGGFASGFAVRARQSRLRRVRAHWSKSLRC